MLNPTELINPRCQQTGTTPVLRTTHHLFLDLPKLTEELQAYIDETSDLGGWSSNCLAVSPALLHKDPAPPLLLRNQLTLSKSGSPKNGWSTTGLAVSS